MRKLILIFLLGVVLGGMVTTAALAFQSGNKSVEDIWNLVYDSTNTKIRIVGQ